MVDANESWPCKIYQKRVESIFYSVHLLCYYLLHGKTTAKNISTLPLEPDEHILWEEQPESVRGHVKQRYGKLTAIGVILLGIVFFGVQDIFNRDGLSDFSIDLEEPLSVMITRFIDPDQFCPCHEHALGPKRSRRHSFLFDEQKADNCEWHITSASSSLPAR